MSVALEYYCLFHALERRRKYMCKGGVEARTSQLPNAGAGLFATKAFTKNDVICEYRGEVLGTKEALHVGDKSYLMRLGNGVYVDARDSLDVMARYINDCRSKGVHNVVFDKQPEQQVALVRALHDIEPGEELFADYGRWYWLAYNMTHPSSPIK
ncbi:Aste57867_21405 [Aphanomyces stellatus]|uniref:Aste57867_21405 protein n=1 Tax=Aphanomyces stellatus TaxID=120398 RepID=A0A485LJI3_9STRA|nr:hypothetical protein As57867_021336 [Aphanomyces stellatus]VFT98076.1 Aste57867_21405 [Aphanomyces stellatus]